MKLKFGIKSIFKYLYIVFFLINLFLIYLIYDFTQKNVLSSINPGNALMYLQDRKYSEDLNIKKFDEVVAKIKQKKNNQVVPFIDIVPDLDNSTSSSDDF